MTSNWWASTGLLSILIYLPRHQPADTEVNMIKGKITELTSPVDIVKYKELI